MNGQSAATRASAGALRIEPVPLSRLRAIPIGALPALIVAGGFALRLGRYFLDHSLWLDESLLALNLTTKSYAELLDRLEFGQGAPLGFLFLEKLAIDVFGDGELAFRLFPLIASTVALLIFYPVARRLVAPTAALVGLVLFATMESFLRYSAEAKPYSFDVLATLLLLWLFASRLDATTWRSKDVAALAVAGAVAIWFSFAVIFVLAGFGLAAALPVVRDRAWKPLGKVSLVGAAWLASFGISYVVTLHDLGTAEGVAAAQTSDPGRNSVTGRVKGLYLIFSEPGDLPRTLVGLAALATLAGAVVLMRDRPRVVLLFGAIGAATFVAGALDRYPIVGRFLLFFLPIAILLAASGAVALREVLRTRLPLVGVALLALLLVPPAASAMKHVVAPPRWEEIEPPLAYLHDHWRPGDTLYVYFTSQYAFRYYLECESCNPGSADYRRTWPIRPLKGTRSQWSPAFAPGDPSIVVGSNGPQPQQHVADLERVRGKARVWVLVSEPWNVDSNLVLGPLDAVGKRLDAKESGIAGVYLYDLR